jgi:DNA-binding CsgD family transcriptional regulator
VVLLGVGQALRCLRSAVSLQALFGQATCALCERVGFERAAFFSLRGSELVAESVCAREGGDHRLEQLFPEPLRLDPSLYEAEVLRRRLAMLVEEAAADPRALAALPGTRSYVTAPVVCEEQAVGLVHADRGPAGEPVDELDRATLWVFVEGLGHALEHGVLAERLRTHSERVLALARSTEASVTQVVRASGGLPPASRRFSATTARMAPDRELMELLTRREREVLVMLAEGETNGSIARRLVVTEDTVKTHVKHILRKLGVRNRSQAVSRYFMTRDTDHFPAAAPNGAKNGSISPLRPNGLGGHPA